MFNEFYVVKHCDGIRNFLTRNFLNQFRLGLFREAGHFGQVEKSVLANLSAESLGLGFDLSVQGFISSQLGFFVRSLPDKALYDLIGSKCVYDLSEFSFGIDQLPVYYRKFTNGGECGCQIIYVAYIVFFFVERVEISSFFRSRVVLFTRIDQDIHAMDLLPEITFVDFTSENRLVKHL